MRWACALTLLLVLLLPAPGEATNVTEAEAASSAWENIDTAGIDAIGQNALKKGIVGLSILVAKDHKVVYTKGFGYSDLARSKPATEKTQYDTGSVGKQLTATAILKLAEQGKLKLSDPVRKYVPSLPKNFPNATLEQLLRHCSGFSDGWSEEKQVPKSYFEQRYGLQLLSNIEIAKGEERCQPGETWLYSNAGFIVLGIVAEVASGKRYDEFVHQELIDPIGLSSMNVLVPESSDRMADAIHSEDGKLEVIPPIDMTAYSGSGALTTDVSHLFKWIRALEGGKVVSKASVQAMRTATTVKGVSTSIKIPSGITQRLGILDGHRKIDKGGTGGGSTAMVAQYPDDGLTIIVLCNTQGSDVPHADSIEPQIARHLFGSKPPKLDSIKRQVPEEIKEKIAGSYTSDERITFHFDGEALVLSLDGKELRRLTYVGDMTFAREDNVDITYRFVMDGDKAGWMLFEYYGSYLDVYKRLPTE